MTLNKILHEDLATAIIDSATNVFTTSFHVEVKCGMWNIINTPLTGDFSGTVYLNSNNCNAVFSLVFSENTIRYILSSVYGDAIKDHDVDNNPTVMDGLGEITNMIFAGVKKRLNDIYNYSFTMTIPVVITGSNHVIRRHKYGNSISLQIPCSCSNGTFFVEVSIDSNSAE